MSRAVARGTAINLAARLAAVALVLAITTVAARLGTEQQGVFALFTSVEGLLLALMSGFGIALARRVSHHGELSRGLLGAVVLACIAAGALAGLALWGFSRVGPAGYQPLWMLALAAPFLLLAPNVAGVWLGQGRMLPMGLVSIAPPALALAAIAAFALAQAVALPVLLAAWVAAKVVVGLVLLALLLRRERLAAPDLGALRAELPFVVTIALTNLVSLANYRVGLFVVERTLGLSATGVYSIAVMVAELLWFVSGSLTQAVYGRIGTPDRERSAQTTLRALHLSWLALLAAAPLLWAAAALVLPRALGPAYADSLIPLALLLPGVLAFGGASAMSAWFTNHAGRPQVPAQVAAGSLALNALLALLLVPRLGPAGAALAASAAYVFSVLLLAWRFAAAAGLPLAAVLRPGRHWGAGLRALASRAGGHR
ncbi:teichoic acid transporter [Rubrivivax gelatinosus]|uniref:polysaccharide biosynthesis C-terminal domain-containing protein n=1 Tax=Rubrivivax gelatinosus TaxID=28068 RepID=UPI001906FD1A|nr:polysaccharide biosynthesis C-terminal domain-containing protein [Rubrivivax gelatinosus]MBK1614705.1 teichoic acid transporter [Rubrivivax gelatinosus]